MNEPTECQISPREAIKRLEVKESAPRISWGEAFRGWETHKKLNYLKRFGEAMNYAAARLQDERNAIAGIAQRQEAQLVQAKESMLKQAESFNQEIARAQEEKQELYQAIIDVRGLVRQAHRLLRAGKSDEARELLASGR